MKTLITIGGPTCVGKTEVAHYIGKILKGEIISADARQIYKYLDIGTAKPPLKLREELNYFSWWNRIVYSEYKRWSFYLPSSRSRFTQEISRRIFNQ
jgi:tRNA dimethylallyltransferase